MSAFIITSLIIFKLISIEYLTHPPQIIESQFITVYKYVLCLEGRQKKHIQSIVSHWLNINFDEMSFFLYCIFIDRNIPIYRRIFPNMHLIRILPKGDYKFVELIMRIFTRSTVCIECNGKKLFDIQTVHTQKTYRYIFNIVLANCQITTTAIVGLLMR